jgi:hypothetical protein
MFSSPFPDDGHYQQVMRKRAKGEEKSENYY